LGVASLSRVTVIAPRSDFEEVAKHLAMFEEFHPSPQSEPVFDPALQELDVRAVRLFAQADQAAKDLSIQLMPGALDVVFRGVKIEGNNFDARDWRDLLSKAEELLSPVAEEVRVIRNSMQAAAKERAEAEGMMEALGVVSSFSADIGSVSGTKRLKVALAVVENEALPELQKSLSELIFVSQPVSQERSLVLVAAPASEAQRVERTMKALEVRQLVIPEGLPQNPAEAYTELAKKHEDAGKRLAAEEVKLALIREKHGKLILSVRELAEVARNMLDEIRGAGGMKRFALLSGYVPSRRESEFRERFSRWVVHSERVTHDPAAPTLMENPRPMKPFEIVTREQGTPGHHEVDPTPLISFVFPIFFGIMFGDLGHGIILTLFALLIRRRGTGSLRQWGNIFLAAGVSSCVMGVAVGEFFGFSLRSLVPIPVLVEIVQRPPVVASATLDPAGIQTMLVVAILIGIAHLATGLGLDVYQAARAGERVELLTEKLPSFTMYLSGIGYGLAFIGAGYSFNVLKTAAPAPLLGLPNNVLGGASLAVVIASMVVLMVGRGVAILLGKAEGESAASAFANGGIEVFERISQFLANTISYVRLAIMLLIHASLLLAVNMLLSFPIYISAVPIVIFNILIIVFEVLIVYIQDLRLHIYEFFTKFYGGTGTPFRKIFPDRVRVRINWL